MCSSAGGLGRLQHGYQVFQHLPQLLGRIFEAGLDESHRDLHRRSLDAVFGFAVEDPTDLTVIDVGQPVVNYTLSADASRVAEAQPAVAGAAQRLNLSWE
mmetsp:Transcript_26993/g.48066  ORF Transcript_26993/g.48066 Transcript_26993/m.48066 type:complete len:100 (-) Transcript_26993:47-346(-)